MVYTSQIAWYHLHQTALTMMSDFVMEHYQIEEPYRSVSMECGAISALGGLDIGLQKCCVVNLDIRGEVCACTTKIICLNTFYMIGWLYPSTHIWVVIILDDLVQIPKYCCLSFKQISAIIFYVFCSNLKWFHYLCSAGWSVHYCLNIVLWIICFQFRCLSVFLQLCYCELCMWHKICCRAPLWRCDITWHCMQHIHMQSQIIRFWGRALQWWCYSA